MTQWRSGRDFRATTGPRTPEDGRRVRDTSGLFHAVDDTGRSLCGVVQQPRVQHDEWPPPAAERHRGVCMGCIELSVKRAHAPS